MVLALPLTQRPKKKAAKTGAKAKAKPSEQGKASGNAEDKEGKSLATALAAANKTKARYGEVIAKASSVMDGIEKDAAWSWADATTRSALRSQLERLRTTVEDRLTPFARAFLSKDAKLIRKEHQSSLQALEADCVKFSSSLDDSLNKLDEEAVATVAMLAGRMTAAKPASKVSPQKRVKRGAAS